MAARGDVPRTLLLHVNLLLAVGVALSTYGIKKRGFLL